MDVSRKPSKILFLTAKNILNQQTDDLFSGASRNIDWRPAENSLLRAGHILLAEF